MQLIDSTVQYLHYEMLISFKSKKQVLLNHGNTHSCGIKQFFDTQKKTFLKKLNSSRFAFTLIVGYYLISARSFIFYTYGKIFHTEFENSSWKKKTFKYYLIYFLNHVFNLPQKNYKPDLHNYPSSFRKTYNFNTNNAIIIIVHF